MTSTEELWNKYNAGGLMTIKELVKLNVVPVREYQIRQYMKNGQIKSVKVTPGQKSAYATTKEDIKDFINKLKQNENN